MTASRGQMAGHDKTALAEIVAADRGGGARLSCMYKSQYNNNTIIDMVVMIVIASINVVVSIVVTNLCKNALKHPN